MVCVAALGSGQARAGSPSPPSVQPSGDGALPEGPSRQPSERAAAVFERHCAGCHQEGRTEGRAPERFGNILRLEELAREPGLVEPRRPDASRLYQRLLGRHTPLAAFALTTEKKGPAPDEIEAVRDWIESLPPRPAGEARANEGAAAAGPQDGASTIDLALSTDRPAYKYGDLVSISVSASKGCHLTLINVDRVGKAIVLFPNELEPDNAIAPHLTVRVPGDDAGYQLRLDRAGPETVVGICQRTRRRPEGIGFNFEKQRFTLLGDWRTFLRTSLDKEDEIVRMAKARSRRKAKTEPSPIDPDGPAIEGRAVITILVE
jgi:mono/diheme cytochrome c family protein